MYHMYPTKGYINLLLSFFKYPHNNGRNWSELYIKPQIVDK